MKFEHNGPEWWTSEIILGNSIDWLSQELCCYFRPRRVEIVGVSAKDLLEDAHLIVCGTIGLVCRLCWVSGGDVSAGSVRYISTLRDEVSLWANSTGREVMNDI